MKARNLAILLLLAAHWALGQHNLPLPASAIETRMSPRQLEQELDSATNSSFIPFHARYFSLENKPLPVSENEGDKIWNFSAAGFDMRLFMHINSLPVSDTIFIKNKEGKNLEVIHHQNLLQEQWSSLSYPEQILVEHHHHGSRSADFEFEGYSLSIHGKGSLGTTDFGDAGVCEVNVNCPEGQNYRDVQRSVVRILLRIDNFFGWCTGTVMLTTSYDYKPYLLTAEHCGYASGKFLKQSDLDRWEFFFNYASDACSDPVSESQLHYTKLIGADLVARSNDNGGDFGSDFLLLELQNDMAFRSIDSVFFAGWDRSGNAPSSGVSIHHPEGDIKKISTYTKTAISSEIGPDIKDTHWQVSWSATPNGHGVTEAGSSGCPLFDKNGILQGSLTGGFASCNKLFESDYFGKFSYSWTSNGNSNDRQLAPWLDPENTGVLALTGTYRDSGGIPADTSKFSITSLAKDEISIYGLQQLTEETEVQIFSLSGKLLYRNKVVALPNIPEVIDVSNYPSSMFIVRLVGKDETRHYKVVIVDL